jgi:hypothetical protein
MTLKIPRKALLFLPAVLAVAGIAFGAYKIGESSVDEAAIADDAHAAGFEQGKDSGYSNGFDAGQAQGHKEGRQSVNVFKQYSDGYDDGYTAGGKDAIGIGAFDFNFVPGVWYLIQFAEGKHGLPLTVDTESDFQIGRSYFICHDNGICYR